jgi:hypothetical protein
MRRQLPDGEAAVDAALSTGTVVAVVVTVVAGASVVVGRNVVVVRATVVLVVGVAVVVVAGAVVAGLDVEVLGAMVVGAVVVGAWVVELAADAAVVITGGLLFIVMTTITLAATISTPTKAYTFNQAGLMVLRFI